MADFGKLRRGLGSPPPMAEASTNLDAPEIAPVAPPAPPLPVPPLPPVEAPRPRRDGRSLRRTHRTVAFATRVSPEWDERIRDIAERDGLMLVEILERALDAYEKKQATR